MSSLENDLTSRMSEEVLKLSEIKKISRNQFSQNQRKQRERELDMIRNGNMCKKSVLERISKNIDDLEEIKLKREVDERFYNPKIMKAMSCISKSSFFLSEDNLSSMLRIKRWLRHVRRVGTVSSKGIAMRADLKDAEDMFIIKSSIDDRKDYEIVHELVVGVYGTNYLRNFVPNFAYIYGGFKCTPPTFKNSGKLKSWCTSDRSKVHYVIYENISDSISWKEYMKTASLEQFLNMYLQIIYALDKADKLMQFTHYDLHDNNVLIRKLDQKDKFLIKYDTENGQEYILTDRVSTIIDYGMSHIKYEGEDFGEHHLSEFSIRPDESHPFHDVYKLLMFTLYSSYENKELYEGLIKIYKFFDQKNYSKNSVLTQRKIFFSLPLEFSKEHTLLKYAEFIRSTFKCDFFLDKPDSHDVLMCDQNCLDVSSVLSEVGLDHREKAASFFEFYDVYRSTGQKMDIDYPTQKEKFLNDLKSEYKELLNAIDHIDPFEWDIEYNKLSSQERTKFFKMFRKYVLRLISFFEEYDLFLLELFIGIEVMSLFESDLDFSEFYSLNKTVSGMIKEIIRSKKIISLSINNFNLSPVRKVVRMYKNMVTDKFSNVDI